MAAACVVFFLAAVLAAAAGGEAAVVEHTFVVSQMKLDQLCNETLVTVVNGQLPGPTIEVTEGDSVVVHVVNKSPNGVTIHWHGVKQQLNCWADGPAMITQCPIQPNKNFTYRFNVTGQEGTLWWHAHVGCLRGTVHGALIIRPRSGPSSYPFPKPDKEIPLVLGEWWDIDLLELERNMASYHYFDFPTSSTINGKLGDLNNCSGVIADNYILDVEHGKTYLSRIVNAALHAEFYLKIAGHIFTVVAADANYVKPYTTDLVAISPGETLDVLVVADAPPGKYYMVAMTVRSQWLEKTSLGPLVTSRGIMHYNHNNTSKLGSENTPVMSPELPYYDMGDISFYFHGNLTSLPHPLHPGLVPASIDERIFIDTDMGEMCKESESPCHSFASRMNNISFQLPVTVPLLQAHYNNNISSVISMVREFPSSPPNIVFDEGTVLKATSLRRVHYNTTLEIVFQGPPVGFSYPNPMHLHGHDFFILAQGIGTYDPDKDVHTYNLVDPPVRNVALVPRFGWTAIRFVASNPGVWYLHCHLQKHVSSGMAMAFVVEDGLTLDTTLPPPPTDYPTCDGQSSKVS
ncbi:hypothetical protein ACQ4PT_035750 [Festuca glaucescens]